MTGEQLIRNLVTYIIDPIILVIFAAGFFLFVWGLVQFILNLSEGGAQQTEGKQHMLWGIVGMLVMASVHGILALLDNTFELNAFSGQVDVGRFENITIPDYFQFK